MSGTAMRWAWEQHVGNGVAKAVLLALADRADARGVCWPGVEEMAERLELDRRTVQRCLKRLVMSGVIQCDKRSRSDGSQSSNLYLLPIHDAEGEGGRETPQGGSAPGGSGDGPGGDAAESRAGAAESHPGAAECHPNSNEPFREPSKEPSIVNLKGARVTSQELWEGIRARLRPEVSRHAFEMYFGECRAKSIADERRGEQIATLVVECRSAYHAEHIERQYLMLVRKFAHAEIGRVIGVTFVGREERTGEG